MNDGESEARDQIETSGVCQRCGGKGRIPWLWESTCDGNKQIASLPCPSCDGPSPPPAYITADQARQIAGDVATKVSNQHYLTSRSQIEYLDGKLRGVTDGLPAMIRELAREEAAKYYAEVGCEHFRTIVHEEAARLWDSRLDEITPSFEELAELAKTHKPPADYWTDDSNVEGLEVPPVDYRLRYAAADRSRRMLQQRVDELKKACDLHNKTHDINMESLQVLLKQREEARERVAELEGQVAERDRRIAMLDDRLNYGWSIIANAYAGDWGRAHADWRHAATKFRDEYHATCGVEVPDPPAQPSPQQPAADDRVREMLDGQIHLNQALQMAVHLHCKGQQVDESTDKCPTSARALNADLVITKAAGEWTMTTNREIALRLSFDDHDTLLEYMADLAGWLGEHRCIVEKQQAVEFSKKLAPCDGWIAITDDPPPGIVWITDSEMVALVYFKSDGCHLVTGGWLEWDEDGDWNGEGYRLLEPQMVKRFTHWCKLSLPQPPRKETT